MWKATFVLQGGAMGWIVVWYGSWPGLALFGFPVGQGVDYRSAVALGVLVFSLLGFWLGSIRDARTDRAEPSLKWTGMFTALGALAGYVVVWFGIGTLFVAIGLREYAVGGMMFFFIVPVGGAGFSLLGYQFGSTLDGRLRQAAFPTKWTTRCAALGAAIGPVVGFYVVASIVRVSMGGDEWRGLIAGFRGLTQGAPTGGILFCLLGLCFGSVLDERSQRNDSMIREPDST